MSTLLFNVPVDWRAVHEAAIAEYENIARECDANDEPITAQMFRDAAERRRKMIDETEKRLRLEQQSNEQEQETKIESDDSSQQRQGI